MGILTQMPKIYFLNFHLMTSGFLGMELRL